LVRSRHHRLEEFATHAAFSRDGKQLAYAWWIGASVELRIVPLLTAGMSQPANAVQGRRDPADLARTTGRATDAGWRFKCGERTRRHKLALSPFRTATARAEVRWGMGAAPPGRCSSPDGKYLAYDLPAAK
jgi:hypothetical protein